MLNKSEKKKLIDLARSSIMGFDIDTSEISDKLKKPSGVFVTLTKNGLLRGCVGYIEPTLPMYKAAAECAYKAAYCDFRFPPVQKDEIKSLNIEISILSKPKRLVYNSSNKLLQKLNASLGVIVKKGPCQATFLPQVWEDLPNKKVFLSNLCLKAGLAPNFWECGDLEVLTYAVDKFSENEISPTRNF